MRSDGSFLGMRRQQAMLAVGCLLMVWIAYYNGFPLVNGDSGAYLATGLELRYEPSRPIFYGLWIFPFHLSISLWPVILGQALHGLIIIFLAMKALGFELTGRVMATILIGLAAFSCLPWYVSQISPDYSTALVILCAVVLGRLADRLRTWEWWFLLGSYQLFLSFHYSNLILAMGLAVCVAVLNFLLPTPDRIRKALYLAAPILIAIIMNIAVNFTATSRIALSPFSHVFTAGALLEDGTMQLYLRDHCAQERLKLCAYLDRLPKSANEFIWYPNSVLQAIGGPDDAREELEHVIAGTLKAYPLLQARIWLDDIQRQLTWFDTGESIKDYGNSGHYHMIDRVIIDHFPDQVGRYLGSMQNSQNERIRFGFATYYNILVYIALISGMGALVLWWKHIRSDLKVFLFLIFVGLIGNGITTAIFSGVFHRYQNRVIWLVIFSAMLIFLDISANTWRQDKGDRLASGDGPPSA